MIVDNRLLFPLFKPEIAWNAPIMLIGLTVALLPVAILTGRKPDPDPITVYRNFGALRPVFYKVNNTVSCIVGNPGAF